MPLTLPRSCRSGVALLTLVRNGGASRPNRIVWRQTTSRPIPASQKRATLAAVSAWTWSLVALGVAGLALLVAIGSCIFLVKAIRRERERRSQRLNEAVFDWASRAATTAEVEELRQMLLELSDLKESMSNSDLRRAVSQLDDRLTSLEAEEQARAETRFPRLPRR
jgi:hypothetical protein